MKRTTRKGGGKDIKVTEKNFGFSLLGTYCDGGGDGGVGQSISHLKGGCRQAKRDVGVRKPFKST